MLNCCGFLQSLVEADKEIKHTKDCSNLCVTLVTIFCQHSITPVKSKCLSITPTKSQKEEKNLIQAPHGMKYLSDQYC